MSELIPWYLVELRSRLTPFLPATKVETIVKEAESHLQEAVRRLTADLQITEDQAAAAAIDAFGRPEKVAMTHLRENHWRPMGISPIWLVLGGGSLATLCWVMHWQWLRGFFDNMGATWQNGLAGFVGTLALLIFGVGCYAGRRRYRLEVLGIWAAMSVGIVLAFSFWIVGATENGQGLSHVHLSRDVANIHQDLAKLDRLETYVHEGSIAFASAKTENDVPAVFTNPQLAEQRLGLYDLTEQMDGRRLVNGNDDPNFGPVSSRFIIPSDFIYAMVDGRVYGLREETDFSHAVLWWRRHTGDALKSISREKGKLNSLLASAAEARNGRLFFFNPTVYSEAVISVPFFLPALFLVEALAYALVRRKRTWPGLVRA
jgi:hypothetical protein